MLNEHILNRRRLKGLQDPPAPPAPAPLHHNGRKTHEFATLKKPASALELLVQAIYYQLDAAVYEEYLGEHTRADGHHVRAMNLFDELPLLAKEGKTDESRDVATLLDNTIFNAFWNLAYREPDLSPDEVKAVANHRTEQFKKVILDIDARTKHMRKQSTWVWQKLTGGCSVRSLAQA